MVNKFYEKNCDSLAVKLWRKAYPDCDHEEIVKKIFDESEGALQLHLRSTPHLDEAELSFNPDYTYRRSETLMKLVTNPSNELSESK